MMWPFEMAAQEVKKWTGIDVSLYQDLVAKSHHSATLGSVRGAEKEGFSETQLGRWSRKSLLAVQ